MKKERTTDVHGINSSRRAFIKKVGTAAAGLLVVPYLKPSGVVAYSRGLTSFYLATVAITDTTNTPADSYVLTMPGAESNRR
jgi:hypothetical protein